MHASKKSELVVLDVETVLAEGPTEPVHGCWEE
jgi:hypothetical protein